MERKYIASLDDGHDWGSVEFWSEHRKGSKANLEDCRLEMSRKWGWKEARRWKVVNVSRYDCY